VVTCYKYKYPYRSFATRVSQLKIWHFWAIGIERNVCRCAFNRYSVITQSAKHLQNSPLKADVSSLHSQKIIALQNLQTFLLKNHQFWVVTLLSQMSDMNNAGPNIYRIVLYKICQIFCTLKPSHLLMFVVLIS